MTAVSREGLARAEEILSNAAAKREAKPRELEPYHPSRDALFPQYRQAAPAAVAGDKAQSTRSTREGAARVAAKERELDAAIREERTDEECTRLFEELQSLKAEHQKAKEREAEVAARRAAYRASEEAKLAKQREEEELAREVAAEAEVGREIATHAAALGALLVELDDALRALWLHPRENFPGAAAPPRWLDQTTQLRVLVAAANHFAAATAGRAGLSFAGERLAEVARVLKAQFIATAP